MKIIVTGGAGFTRLPSAEPKAIAGRSARKIYYTYVLKSLRDKKFYTGWTNNLQERLSEHNLGKAPSTRARRPFEPICYEACLDKEKAIVREKYLKSGFGRNYLNNRLGLK